MMPVAEITPRAIARNVFLWCNDSWANARYLYRNRLLNAPSRRLFETHRPVLDSLQQRVTDELTTNGVATVHFDELFESAERWSLLCQSYESFANSERVQEAVRSYKGNTVDSSANKEYLIRKYPQDPTLGLNDPWLQLALDTRLLNIVNSYMGLWSKLHYLDLWYTIPLNVERSKAASQHWHRDPEDERIIKVFLYFSEVDEEAGPLQYIPGSRRRSTGPYGHLGHKRSQAYPPERELEDRIPQTEWWTGLGRPGTLALVDTTGFHRGGYATERARLSATWTYVTPASYLARRFGLDRSANLAELSEEARFALS
jgi:hypothetical protein